MIYMFQVRDSFFPQTFEAEIEATTQKQAEQELKEYYAEELGTDIGEITLTYIGSKGK